MSYDLKPCPFCGGADIYLQTIPQGLEVPIFLTFFECGECDARGPTNGYNADPKGKESAFNNCAQLWNDRAGEKA